MRFHNIVVGISGGVDSAVAAYLLKQRGFNVLGVFMKNWDEKDETGHCAGEKDFIDAQNSCKKLGIRLQEVNYVKEYWNSVFVQFLDDYQQGLTPNPDILCNKHIKFKAFHKFALEDLGYDAIATGHYANTNFGPFLENYREDEMVRLLIPRDTVKDQTFFLSGIDAQALRHTMFPLAPYTKSEVRQLALDCGLERLVSKKESTGICFIGNRNFQKFIEEYISCKSGDFVDIDTGQVVGKHGGIHQWTLGQRCRLRSFPRPYFVAEKNVPENVIYVASGHNHSALMSDSIHVQNINWLSGDPFREGPHKHTLDCRFRFQHTKPLVNCTVTPVISEAHEFIIKLEKPLRALTPGQYAVFYNDTECLGSGRILKVNR